MQLAHPRDGSSTSLYSGRNSPGRCKFVERETVDQSRKVIFPLVSAEVDPIQRAQPEMQGSPSFPPQALEVPPVLPIRTYFYRHQFHAEAGCLPSLLTQHCSLNPVPLGFPPHFFSPTLFASSQSRTRRLLSRRRRQRQRQHPSCASHGPRRREILGSHWEKWKRKR